MTAAAMLAATLMIAQHIAGKATRDALFLTTFDISALPKMMMLGAGISVVAVLLMSRLLTRYGPARLMPPLYLASALLLVLQWFVADLFPQAAAVTLYLHVSVVNTILISGFWSTINERFDPYSAKKVIARLTAATTFGGLLGGVAAKTVASAVDTHAILLMLSGMHLVCAGAIALLARGQKRPPREGQATPNLLAPLKRSPLIRRMALLALLVATTAAVLDYILKAEAAATLSDADLISFFSYFYMAVGLGTFLVQSMVGNKALRWLGLGGSMAAWPLVILATGSGALLFRSLASATLMRASANLLYNSFFRAGFELLYTPISPAVFTAMCVAPVGTPNISVPLAKYREDVDTATELSPNSIKQSPSACRRTAPELVGSNVVIPANSYPIAILSDMAPATDDPLADPLESTTKRHRLSCV